MFDDPKKELRKMEKQLLRAELPEEEADNDDFDELMDLLQEKLNPQEDPNLYYDDPSQVDLTEKEFYGKYAAQPPERENLTGLVVTAWLLTAGIVAVALWWVVKLL